MQESVKQELASSLWQLKYNIFFCFSGTNGGVTFIGLVVSLLGGLVVGVGHYFSLLISVSDPVLLSAPPQWPVILVGAVGGLLGSVIDSVLGATLQFSGL